MKTTTSGEEEQLKLAEHELRNALTKIQNVREQMATRLDYNLVSHELHKTLIFKECDALWNSADCINSAILFLHDVED